MIRNLQSESYDGDQVDQSTFVDHLERVLPSDTASFDGNMSMLLRGASRLQGKKKMDSEARLMGMDPIERNTHACKSRTHEAQQGVRATKQGVEEASRDLKRAIDECKAASIKESRLYTVAGIKTGARVDKELEEEEAQEAFSVAQQEQHLAERETVVAHEYDEEKAIEEEDAVTRTKEARIVKKEADEEHRAAIVKRQDAVVRRDDCAAEVKRLQELLRLAMLALEQAEEVARIAYEVEAQREREAEAAAQVPKIEQRCVHIRKFGCVCVESPSLTPYLPHAENDPAGGGAGSGRARASCFNVGRSRMCSFNAE